MANKNKACEGCIEKTSGDFACAKCPIYWKMESGQKQGKNRGYKNSLRDHRPEEVDDESPD